MASRLACCLVGRSIYFFSIGLSMDGVDGSIYMENVLALPPSSTTPLEKPQKMLFIP